jgi:CBS domain-containing protein
MSEPLFHARMRATVGGILTLRNFAAFSTRFHQFTVRTTRERALAGVWCEGAQPLANRPLSARRLHISRYKAMKDEPYKLGDGRKLALVQTVRSILEHKGSEVASISPHGSVYEAIAEMARNEVGALLVLSDGHILGIISERDYARKVILQGRSSKETTVHEIMTISPITVTPDATVDECLRIMTDKHIRHLPVVKDGRVQGIVSIGDLVKAIISAQSYTIEQLHAYIAPEYPL